MTITVATANIAKGTTGYKRLLLPVPQRYTRARQFFNEQGAAIVTGQEFHNQNTRLYQADGDGWGVFSANPNNRTKRGTIANTILNRQALVRRIDKVNIQTDMRGRALGLNYPVALFEDKSKNSFAVISIHNPSAKTDIQARNAALTAQVEYVRLCWEAGIPVLIGGDFNQGDPENWFKRGLPLVMGVQDSVDHIMGVGFKFSKPESHREAGVRGRKGFSDHPVLVVDATPTVFSKAKSLPPVPPQYR